MPYIDVDEVVGPDLDHFLQDLHERLEAAALLLTGYMRSDGSQAEGILPAKDQMECVTRMALAKFETMRGLAVLKG